MTVAGSMVKFLSSERTLSSINLYFSYVLIISSITNLLFSSHFELVLTGAVPVVFCTINIILKALDNSLSSLIVLLSKLIAISSSCRKPLNVRKGLTAFQKSSFFGTPFEAI